MAESGDDEQKGVPPVATTWPDGFPLGCPPPDAVPAAGDVYRIVTTDPPSLNDFRPWRAENPLRPGEKDSVRAWGTSVFDDVGDAASVIAGKRKRVPGVSTWRVALGTLRAEFGRMSSPSGPGAKHPSHRDWWIPKGVDPSWAFAVIPGVP